MRTLKDQIISSHIAENYPNARIVTWDQPDSGLTFYTAEELGALDGDWFPLCANLDPETGKVVYGGRSRVIHTYTEGETGAGKTTRFAMQSIRALSSTKGKPSFLVVDIHGELVENLYDHLKQQGYTVRILNCDDPSRSDTYNPFLTMARRCAASGEIDNQTVNEIRKIAEIMQPVESTKDPIWDQGARSYVNGCIMDKFEDLIQGLIQPEYITLYNIIENHYWIRTKLSEQDGNATLQKIPHYSLKDPQAISVQKMIGVTNNAERTTRSYFGVVENHYDAFGQPTLYQLSSSSTIDIEEFIAQPTAIFIQSGNTRIADDLLSLMTNEIYNTAVRIGKKSPTKMLPRKIHCFLDEFANSCIAEGPEFIRMLTTSRKFGMYWHMLLQCDAQLDRKFDPNMARIIRANCTEIFMGSHDYDTTLRFAQSCGQKTVESLGSRIAQQDPVLTTVNLITADKLSLIPEGWMYIKTNRCPLLYTYIEAFYKCPEFKATEDILSVYPVNDFNYRSTYFTPDDIRPPFSEAEYILLRFIHEEGPIPVAAMQDATGLGQTATADLAGGLVKLGYITIDEDADTVRTNISDKAFTNLQRFFANVKRKTIVTEIGPDAMAIMETVFEAKMMHMTRFMEEFKGKNITAPFQKLMRLGMISLNPRADRITCSLNTAQYGKLRQRNLDRDQKALDDPIFRACREAMKAHPDYPNIDLCHLRALTCTPQALVHMLEAAQGKKRYSPIFRIEPDDVYFIRTIIEVFVLHNDFEDKADWDTAFRREMTVLKQLGYLPREVMDMFHCAHHQFVFDMTAEDIEKLKKPAQD